MSITFQVVPDKNYFISSWEGDITDSEMLDSYIDFYQGAQWDLTLNELADLRGISVPNISSTGIRQLAKYVEEYFKGKGIAESKTAIVSDDPFSDGMAQLYDSLIRESPERIAVFQDFNEAEFWLANTG